MKYRIRNVTKARRGVEKAGGGYVWIEPGGEKTIDVADARGVAADPALEAQALSEVPAPPASLKVKAAGVGKSAFSGFLDRSIPLIEADLPSQTVEALQQLRRDEEAGKSRKGVIGAIDAEIEARSA